MKTTMPQPVADFIQAVNSADPLGFASVFAIDAVVMDVGREFRGVTAIKEWGDREIFAAQVSLDIKDVAEGQGQTVLTVLVEGTFDRTGLPDPLLMDQCFTVVDDKILALTCSLSPKAGRA